MQASPQASKAPAKAPALEVVPSLEQDIDVCADLYRRHAILKAQMDALDAEIGPVEARILARYENFPAAKSTTAESAATLMKVSARRMESEIPPDARQIIFYMLGAKGINPFQEFTISQKAGKEHLGETVLSKFVVKQQTGDRKLEFVAKNSANAPAKAA